MPSVEPRRDLGPPLVGGRGGALLSASLLALAVAVLAWRFVGLGDVPFGMDEPQLLEAARAQLAAGRPATVSPLGNTSGITYGPTAIWFYGIVQAVFGPSVRVAVAALGAVATGAQVYFCLAVARTLHPRPRASMRDALDPTGRWVLAPVLLLVATSPQLHLWARIAWDNQLTTAIAFVVVGLLLTHDGPSPGLLVTTGVLLGLGVATHPMLVPFAVLAGVVAILREPVDTLGTAVRRAAWLGVPAIAVLVPWAMGAARAGGGSSILGGTSDVTPAVVLLPFQLLGSHALPVLTIPQWAQFLAAAPANALATGARVLQDVAWPILGVGGLVVGARRGSRVHEARVLAAASLVLWPLFLQFTGRLEGAHYVSPVVWAPLLGVGLLLAAPRTWIRRTAVVVVVLVAATQVAVLGAWRGWIHDQAGTRGPRYGTTLAEQAAAMEWVCGVSRGDVLVVLEVVGFPDAYTYLAATQPACQDRGIRVCRPIRGCPTPRAGEEVVRIRYASDTDARLVVAPSSSTG